MGYIRRKYRLYNSIEVNEFHDSRHPDPDRPRCEKKKRTPEEMQRANQRHKEAEARRLVWANFEPGDYVRTLTWAKEKRPADMKEAQKAFRKFYLALKREYGKRFYELLWIANIEKTPRGAWHIHFICNRIMGGGDIIKDLWRQNGAVYDQDLQDFRDKGKDIGSYISKSPGSTKEGEHEVEESKYTHSRNLVKPEPEDTEITGWKMTDAPRTPKGYYLDKNSYYEGINCNGYKFRVYIFRRLIPKPRNRRLKRSRNGKQRRKARAKKPKAIRTGYSNKNI